MVLMMHMAKSGRQTNSLWENKNKNKKTYNHSFHDNVLPSFWKGDDRLDNRGNLLLQNPSL